MTGDGASGPEERPRRRLSKLGNSKFKELGVNHSRWMDVAGGLVFHPWGRSWAKQLSLLPKGFYFSPNREQSSSSLPALAISAISSSPKGLGD